MSALDLRLTDAPFRLTIPPDLSKGAEVREWLGRVATAASLEETRIFDLQVVASEAVANAIEHAASTVEIEAWVLPDRLVVEISNDGDFRPGMYKDDGHRRRGLGLPLMVSLADQVHVSRRAGGKTKVTITFLRLRLESTRKPEDDKCSAEASAPQPRSYQP